MLLRLTARCWRARRSSSRRVCVPAATAVPGSRVSSQAQMSESQQTVIGVLAIGRVVGPMSVKRPGVCPEGVDEVQAGLFQGFERYLHAGERVDRGGSGEQVRDGS